jgi:hypothetical protein
MPPMASQPDHVSLAGFFFLLCKKPARLAAVAFDC